MTVAVLLIAVAGACVAGALVELLGARPRRRRADRTSGPLRRARVLNALGRLGGRVGSPTAPRDLEARIAAAGLAPRVTAAEVMALKRGTASTALIAIALVLAAGPSRGALAIAIAAPCAAFLAPDLWLRRRAAARARIMSVELPDILDLLGVAVAAGLSSTRAIAEVGARRRGLVAAEMRTAAARIELGVGYHEALAGLVARCPLEGAAAMVAAVERTERHGVPLGPALHALASRSRAAGACRLREEAARAAPKIQLVVAVGLVPAALLLVAAAVVASAAP
jgi:tight adherence protein C